MPAKNLQEVMCTRHNLVFAFDANRVRALDAEPAVMQCPMCNHVEMVRLLEEKEEMRRHRDLLLEAIDLKATLQRVAL